MSPASLSITLPATASTPVRFAAAELQRYLGEMTGATVVLAHGDGPGHSLVVGTGAVQEGEKAIDTDGFVIQPTANGAVISGGSARAVLHGAYALLEQLGCRWSLHGRTHEIVPRLADWPAIQPQRSTPRFDVRGYAADIMTWHYGDPAQLTEHLAADSEFIDWMGKSGGNAYLFIRHPFDTQLTIPELLPQFAHRGIDLEYGGHVIPLLLPREEFAQHPEFFPQSADGARTEFGNLCTASAAALHLATENAVHYVREYPELRVLHIWGADLWGGGWCHCTDCAAVTAQDQSLRLCNAVAVALAEQGLARPVCYIAYHDTLEPDLIARPTDNVFVEYAPRERCYGHSLGDPACPTNRHYRAALERYADLFQGRVRIFEYYADAILFCGCTVPLSEVIAADLDYYHRLGIREITNLHFGAFSSWAYPINLLVYAAATRSAQCDVARIRAAYAGEFDPHTTVVTAAFAELEAAMRDVVTYGDIRRLPRRPEARRDLQPRIQHAIDRLASAADRLTPAVGQAAASALYALVRYNRAVLAGVHCELQGADAAAKYDEALAIMGSVDRRFTGLWGAVNLPVIHSYHSAGLFG